MASSTAYKAETEANRIAIKKLAILRSVTVGAPKAPPSGNAKLPAKKKK